MENKIMYLDITSIEPNPLNPRKSFDDTALGELSVSIKNSGVLQPVTVRPAKSGKKGVEYQLVCGERRWRAAAMAGLTDIPAIIRELTDDEAMDVAITENLQRKDVSPMEEADSFKYLLDKGSTIDDLCLRFAKSEPYVRGRMKLLGITDEFRILLDKGEISISQAMEITKFEVDVQTRMYKDHFTENMWNSWRDLKASKIYQNAVDYYTKELARYEFDKTECETCPNCTKNSCLFASIEEASCQNDACLHKKNLDYKIGLALNLRKKHPEAEFYSRDGESEIKRGLEVLGNEVVVMQSYISRVGAVISKDLKSKLETGEVVLVIDIQHPCLGYIDQVQTGGGKVQSLREKDKRNKEIQEENTVSDVRNAVCNMDVKALSGGELTDYESQLSLFIMVKSLTRDQQQNLGKVEFYSMSDEVAWDVVQNATPEQTAYIHRCSILNKIGDHTRKDFKTDLFFDWVSVRDSQIVPAATQKHEGIYQKRHERLEARIAEIESSKSE